MSGKKVSDPNCREPALRVLRTIGVRHLFSARSLPRLDHRPRAVISDISQRPNGPTVCLQGWQSVPQAFKLLVVIFLVVYSAGQVNHWWLDRKPRKKMLQLADVLPERGRR